MLNSGKTLTDLRNAPMRPGRVVWIGLRSARRRPMTNVQSAEAEVGKGLVGDRFKARHEGRWQVTLVQQEHLAAIGSCLGRESVAPELLRRSLVVEGINLLALKGKRFRIDGVLLEYTGECHPCSRMEESQGEGGYNMVRGHGGITARVIVGGVISLKDSILVD